MSKGGGGPKATPLDRNYEKKYQKVKRSKNSNHPPEHSRTHTHTTSVLPVMHGASLVVYQKSRSSAVGKFTDAAASALASPPAHDKAKGIVSASSRILHLSQYTVIQCYIPPMGLMHLHI